MNGHPYHQHISREDPPNPAVFGLQMHPGPASWTSPQLAATQARPPSGSSMQVRRSHQEPSAQQDPHMLVPLRSCARHTPCCLRCRVRLADTDQGGERVPWCAIPSAGLHLEAGPAPCLTAHAADAEEEEEEVEEHASSTISLAINLLTCTSSILTQSTVHSSSCAHGCSSSSAVSVMASHEQLPSVITSLATAPAAAASGAAASRRLVTTDWSAVVSNPVLPHLKLHPAVGAAAGSKPCAEPPASPAASAVGKAASLVCPPAPRRPRPAILLVPLSELGSIAAAT